MMTKEGSIKVANSRTHREGALPYKSYGEYASSIYSTLIAIVLAAFLCHC